MASGSTLPPLGRNSGVLKCPVTRRRYSGYVENGLNLQSSFIVQKGDSLELQFSAGCRFMGERLRGTTLYDGDLTTALLVMTDSFPSMYNGADGTLSALLLPVD